MSLFLGGCQTVSYYAQAIHGQAQIFNREHPIADVLADPSTPPKLRTQLEHVLELRTFAKTELHLPANGHYLAYADLGRRFAVWNVYAAPEFSLTPKGWWYPIVGRLDYRGYFSEEQARHYAERLRAKGYDAYVGGVAAYSTLGWFHDPVLNTFVDYSDVDLAELLFHELAHQRLYASGDTEFNEAFATAVAEEGLRRWLIARHEPDALCVYETETRRTEEFLGLVAGARARLSEVYDASATENGSGTERSSRDPNALRLRKQAVFAGLREDYARLRARWGGDADYDRWFAQDLNNAQLNSIETYYHLVPAFRQILKARGGDIEAFLEEAHALAGMSKKKRHARLEEWRSRAEEARSEAIDPDGLHGSPALAVPEQQRARPGTQLSQ